MRQTPVAAGLLRFALRGLWFLIIPALVTLSVLRYLVPRSTLAPGLEGTLAMGAEQHLPLLCLALFSASSALIRYWRDALPFGHYLSTLPWPLAVRVPRRRRASVERASELTTWVERSGQHWLTRVSIKTRPEVAEAVKSLSAALRRGKWSQVEPLRARLGELTSKARRRARARANAAYAVLAGAAVVLALGLRARYFQVYEVHGTSMVPSFTPGEQVLGRMTARSSALPERGDVVVVRLAVDGREQELIKRVIGLPGDRIGMWGAHPIINGWTTPVCDVGAYYSYEDRASRAGDPGVRLHLEFLEDRAYLTLQPTFSEPFRDYVVQPNELFVLGDNRSSSRDSRTLAAGAPHGVPLSAVKATIKRVLFRRGTDGVVDLESVLRPLSVHLKWEGVDLSQLEAAAARCLALGPGRASPPRAASVALADGAR